MRISFCCANTQAQPWLQELRAALPQADISLWQSGDAPADYAIVWMPPQAFFDEQTQLKGIFNIGAGVDALLALRLPVGVPLIRLDDAGMAVQMAEYVCHAVIGYYRGFAHYAQAAQARQWQPQAGIDRSAFAVGLMGMGVLGQRVARALAQFDFPVNGWSNSPKAIAGVRSYSGQAELAPFLAASQVLVCALPLTTQTRDILNRETLGQLPRGAYLINVARGGHLVEEDLLELMERGHIRAATLDVFRTEPLPSDHPFWTHPHITITPHICALTQRTPTIAQIVHKLNALEAGATALGGWVQRDRGY